jgi:2-dehydropantoate 2-reductase
MKICVVGAGAIGGMLGIKLALAGEDVTLIARGPHLEAMKKNGLKVIWNDGTESVATNCHCTSNMREVWVMVQRSSYRQRNLFPIHNPSCRPGYKM